MGHLFGLGHPDNIPDNIAENIDSINPNPNPENTYQMDIAAGMHVNAFTCFSLWNRTAVGVPDGLSDSEAEVGYGGYPVRNAVMQAYTQHNPKACLEDDDVEGILTLYPDCTLTSQSTNVCLHTYHNIGFVRLMIFVLLPLLSALIFVISFASCVSRYLEGELEETREDLEETEDKLSVAQHEVEELELKKVQKFARRFKNTVSFPTGRKGSPGPKTKSMTKSMSKNKFAPVAGPTSTASTSMGSSASSSQSSSTSHDAIPVAINRF
mmetsp:Transcript_37009/g.73922  ORF Transcript_37009/g.73922 Transcript_37009/m.73922 type:complete len:267 (+) Transcript_37009:1255-2055(+)